MGQDFMAAEPHLQSNKVVYCPRCEYPLPLDSKTCPQCGVDMALFALLAEKSYLEGLPQTAPIQGPHEAMVPRIGEYLLEQGILSPKKLEIALNRQKELAEQGKSILLGQTLLQLGYLDRETLDRAITRQIIELHTALQESNRTLERRVRERTAELRRALDRLTEVNQIKANLISNISHELRTPLAHIKGYTELFSDGQLGALTGDQEEALGVIQRASERLGTLIEDLIEFSTASREGLTLNLSSVDIHALVESVFKRSEEKAGKTGVQLESEIPASMPLLKADMDRLFWVLYQLVDNSIKFTPSGGEVRLKAELVDERVEISVSDTGIGIPGNRIDEIFEPFHQLDGSPTRRYGGTGLGLALVKLILNAHGTNIKVQSVEGEGSQFSFSLPIEREDQ